MSGSVPSSFGLAFTFWLAIKRRIYPLYIGQADGVRNRIDSYYQNKDFWDWGIIFVSNSGGLNRAHVTWLEYALVNRATATGRCHVEPLLRTIRTRWPCVPHHRLPTGR